MSNRTDYNGWTNRETWLINLHFEPSSQSDLDFIKENLEYELSLIANRTRPSFGGYGSFFSDFIDLNKINWYELEQHVQENYEEE